MEAEYTPRGTEWRKRGTRPLKVPPVLMEMLQTTYDKQVQANIAREGASDQEVAAVVRYLKRGAEKMGKHLRVQSDDEAIRFWVEDK
jgi:cytochrome c1